MRYFIPLLLLVLSQAAFATNVNLIVHDNTGSTINVAAVPYESWVFPSSASISNAGEAEFKITLKMRVGFNIYQGLNKTSFIITPKGILFQNPGCCTYKISGNTINLAVKGVR